jgi:hypothetical protein
VETLIVKMARSCWQEYTKIEGDVTKSQVARNGAPSTVNCDG